MNDADASEAESKEPPLDDLLAEWPDGDDGSVAAEDSILVESKADGGDPLEDCEAAVGHRFSDRSLLEQSLVHASAAATRHLSNERLEFLGDAIFGAVVCEVLFETFPKRSEGELTRMKSAVVSRATCAKMTRDVGLDRYVVVGRGVASRTGRMPNSILAAVFEAVVAAVYLDAGYEAASAFIRRLTAPHIAECSRPEDFENYKSMLQQRAQRDLGEAPDYAVTDERGPDHNKSFRVAVTIAGETYPPAWGANKKDAEQRAAGNALAVLDDDPPPFAIDTNAEVS